MDKLTIKSNDGANYSVIAIKDSFARSIDKGIKWAMRYEVKDQSGELVGYGGFSVNCPMDHLHLEDTEIFSILFRIGASSIKEDLDKGLPIESKGYNFNVSTCRE